jgi:hypothetical protein
MQHRQYTTNKNTIRKKNKIIKAKARAAEKKSVKSGNIRQKKDRNLIIFLFSHAFNWLEIKESCIVVGFIISREYMLLLLRKTLLPRLYFSM